MPSVATSFFLPPVPGAQIAGVAPVAADGFGLALASVAPVAAAEPAPANPAGPLNGLATAATLTVLNDIAPAPVAAQPEADTPAGDVTKIVAEDAPASPMPRNPVKSLPAILVTPPMTDVRGTPVPARPATPVVAAPAATVPPVAAPPAITPAANTPEVKLADKVEPLRRAPRVDASDAETLASDPALQATPTPPAATIAVAAAVTVAPARPVTSDAPIEEPTIEDVPTTTKTAEPRRRSEEPPTPEPGPLVLRTQEPSATSDTLRTPGILPAQEHGAIPVEPSRTPAMVAAVATTGAQKVVDAPERARKADKPAPPSAEIAQQPTLPITVTTLQPAPPAPGPVPHTPSAPEPEPAAKAPAQPLTATATTLATAPDQAEAAPTADQPALAEFASRVATAVERHTPVPSADSAPAPGAPAAAPILGPASLTQQPATAPIPSRHEPTTIAAEPGKIGREMGVVIARHAVTGGNETITVRLDPKEMGRIDVTLSFDDDGRLRAVVAADNPAALDLLRRDSADLNRALVDAGVRADPQSLRFDTRSGGGDQAASGQSGQRRDPTRAHYPEAAPTDLPADPDPRPRTITGRIDMMA